MRLTSHLDIGGMFARVSEILGILLVTLFGLTPCNWMCMSTCRRPSRFLLEKPAARVLSVCSASSDSGMRYSSSPLGGGAHWDALAARYGALKPADREPPAPGFYSTSPSRCEPDAIYFTLPI